MSRWKQYRIKKQQRAKINDKLDKAFEKIADLLMNSKIDEAKDMANKMLIKYPTHTKSWRLVKLVDAWKEVVGPTISNMRSSEKRKVLKAITFEYKNNDHISAETLDRRIREVKG